MLTFIPIQGKSKSYKHSLIIYWTALVYKLDTITICVDHYILLCVQCILNMLKSIYKNSDLTLVSAFQGNIVMQPASGNEQTVCEFVRYCMNCTYTGSIQNVIFITNESTCYKKFETDTTIEAATYVPQTGTCSIYYNDGGLSFAEGHVTYIRTCQSGNGIPASITKSDRYR